VPATQFTHWAADEAPTGQLWPAGQVAHDVALAAVLYEPAGHWLQAVPPVEKVPAAQATHCAALVLPAGHEEPAVQLLQAVAAHREMHPVAPQDPRLQVYNTAKLLSQVSTVLRAAYQM
jgi:hypothetical protein